jgi:hypothetical protein
MNRRLISYSIVVSLVLTFLSTLFFPLAFLFPNYRFPLLIIPLFISVARVGVNDPWCSDALGSIAIAAVITLFFIWLFRIKPAQTAREPSPTIL